MTIESLRLELARARVVEFPLRGQWLAAQSPADRIPSHGTDVLGQRYAFDLVRLDARPGAAYRPPGVLRALLLGVPTRDWHGYGEPVHAALDGEVLAAVDGVPEPRRVQPVRESLLALRNSLAFRPTPEWVSRLVGNHVILRHGSTCSVYAHLAPGSVVIRPGQAIAAGDVLGRVGHTGNSTAPHLHFQLMDDPDPLTARGVPCAFRAYEAERDCRWVRVERGIPGRREQIRSVGGSSAA
jgi:hypothetical protein